MASHEKNIENNVHAQQALKSIKWNYLSSILPKIASPVALVILARLLSPVDYGLLGTSTVVTSIAILLASGGMSKAIIQTKSEDLENSAHTIFWLNSIFTLLLYLIVFLFSDKIATFFKEPRLSAILKIHGLTIIFTGLSVVHQGLMQRRFQFKKITYLSILPVIVSFGVTIPLAYLKYGYWSLVIATVISSIISFAFFVYFSKYRPSFRFNVRSSKQSIAFAWILLLEGFLGWIIGQIDTTFVAKFLSIKDVGIYNFSKTLTNSFTLILYPVFSIAFSYFSRVNEINPAEIPQKLSRFIGLLCLVTFPLIALAIFVAPSAIPTLFSNKWKASIIVFQLMAISQVSWIFMAIPESFNAAGKPKVLLPVNIIQTVATVIIYAIFVRFGLKWLAASQLLLSWIFIFHVYYAAKHLNYHAFWIDIRKYLLFASIASCGMWAIGFMLKNSPVASMAFLGIAFVGIVTYAGLLWLFAQQDIRYVWTLKKRM
jgi:O-antigen/teichoic acid export membrane protein